MANYRHGATYGSLAYDLDALAASVAAHVGVLQERGR